MNRYFRIPLVLVVSMTIAATGICSSLSTGTESACAVEPVDHDSCCEAGSGEKPCPETPKRPTCRPCDGTVAFLLKEKSAEGDAPGPSLAQVPALAPRPESALLTASRTHLSFLSASPPLHLLNVTFRN